MVNQFPDVTIIGDAGDLLITNASAFGDAVWLHHLFDRLAQPAASEAQQLTV